MIETVTVDEAIKKGFRMVSYPAVAVLFGTVIISALLLYQFEEKPPIWSIAILFGLAIIFSWLYYSFMITNWRLWAFENVRNVHELKKRAVQEKLIWAEGSFMEKTEIRNSTAKEKWELLQKKFEREDIFIDDIKIPAETIIYYSKSKNYIHLALTLFLFAGAGYLFATDDNSNKGIVMILGGLFLGYKVFKQGRNKKPQITINAKGIQLAAENFHTWEEIENDEAVRQGYGKNTKSYLKYNHSTGSVKLQIDDFDTKIRPLNKLLILYRARHKNKATILQRQQS